MMRSVVFAMGVILGFSLTSSAIAEQHTVQTPEGPKVAHTRLAPVVVHRVFPPYWGQHIYEAPRGNTRSRLSFGR